ncbi:MAG: SDR family oxidoreductase [Myxococcota bacterium]|nr:SDR family oxidoreductase [Myxococcota bacterium]
MKDPRSTARRVVVISGASSGFGAATAALLAARGWIVYGGSRRVPAAGAHDNGVTSFPLDVTSDDSVEAFLARVSAAEGRLDALVHSAGYCLAGAIEETSLEEAHAQLETNFFGVCRLTRAALPSLRASGRGRVVVVSSLAGMIGVPFQGYYSASKYALEGWVEAMRHEVGPLGVAVSSIAPGDFRTPVTAARQRCASSVSAYAGPRERAIATMEKNELEGPEPGPVASAIVRALESERPARRYRVGTDAVWAPRIRRLLPAPWFERLIARAFRL